MICDYTFGRMGREGNHGTCVSEDPQLDDSLMDFERYLSQKKKRVGILNWSWGITLRMIKCQELWSLIFWHGGNLMGLSFLLCNVLQGIS